MTVFLNGEFVPEENAVVSVFDRGFRYGDGIFEAALARNGRLFRWGEHVARFAQAAAFLRIPLPTSTEELRRAAEELLRLNGLTEAVVRIAFSRGVGPRGYAPTGTEQPTLVVTTEPVVAGPATYKLKVSSFRVAAGDALAQHKTSSRLLHVMAAMEAREAGANAPLLLDTNGHVTEAGSSNLFWIAGETVCTAPVGAGLLPGITRSIVLDLCKRSSIATAEASADVPALYAADGVFVTFTSRGIVDVSAIDGRPTNRSDTIASLASAYAALVRHECGG